MALLLNCLLKNPQTTNQRTSKSNPLERENKNKPNIHSQPQPARQTWSHAPHMQKTTHPTTKQTQKNNATTKHNPPHKQPYGNPKPGTSTQRNPQHSNHPPLK
jgi:hypothetical protein